MLLQEKNSAYNYIFLNCKYVYPEVSLNCLNLMVLKLIMPKMTRKLQNTISATY